MSRLNDCSKLNFRLIVLGGLFLFGGVLMFFDRSLYVCLYQSNIRPATISQTSKLTSFSTISRLAMGNILFLIGLTLIIGVQKTIVFFTRPQKLKGTAGFCAGIILILLRWPLIGFFVELYGLFILFGDFLVTIGQFAGNIPVVGTYIRRGLEILAGERSNAELPV
ncbi:hypothetical protein N7539_008899 [Penicillium diatomitis]|uniref:Uncharacterized protein n=1 Tax=Penicillium diatomitis TaxID=2819901 RepID=A0A9X0BJ72_9EURO|nr:uncharacterized protein N7539_008899 [Penicillium diatomitis]KAJ5469281.1 hypothetical protein N7539_008899 [Penicillium diatomitis]